MNSFEFYSPTKIVFGKNKVQEIGQLLKPYAVKKILLVYGGGSVVKSGLLDTVKNILQGEGISFKEFGGAKPNPTLAHVYEGIDLAIKEDIDFILAIGGGSAIDTAKGIAHGVANPDDDIWEFWLGTKKLTKTTPLATILTIPAAGSECSNSAVLTNEESGQKRGINTDFNRPLFSILDPTLTYTLPVFQVGCGIVDIMMHTLDRYFNPLENEMTDSIAEALLRTVIANGKIAIKDHTDYNAMSELMWAGTLSHNGLTGLGGIMDFSTHQLGHELSAKFDIAHGASLSTVWASLARHIYSEKPSRFARYARNVWGISDDNDDSAALKGIQATEDYFKALGMPVCFSDSMGVQEDEILHELANRCVRGGERTIGSFMVMHENDIYKIYKAANH